MNIRNRLKSGIQGALAGIGVTAERNRFLPVDEQTEFPLVLIYSVEEESDQQEDHFTQVMEPMIHIVVMTSMDSADDDLDEISGDIEDALCRPMCQLTDSSGIIAQRLIYKGISIQPHEQAAHILVGTMRFQATARADLQE